MPANPEYNGTAWAVNPETGELNLIEDGQITATSGSLEEVSGGALEAAGSRIRDVPTGYFRWTMTPDYPTTLHVSPTGFITVEREIDPVQMNAEVYARARYGTTGRAEVLLPNGETREMEVTGWSTKIGDRLIVKAGSAPGDDDRYAYTADVNAHGEITPTQPPAGWEFADTETAMNRAIIRELITQHEGTLEDMIALGMTDSSGQPITSKYDAAQAVAAQMETRAGLAAVLVS